MNYRSDFNMKNFLGLAIFGLVAAGIGAAATMFAIKKREEILLDGEDLSVEEVLDSVEEDVEEIAKEDGEDF